MTIDIDIYSCYYTHVNRYRHAAHLLLPPCLSTIVLLSLPGQGQSQGRRRSLWLTGRRIWEEAQEQQEEEGGGGGFVTTDLVSIVDNRQSRWRRRITTDLVLAAATRY
jgi:hypothetical protein